MYKEDLFIKLPEGMKEKIKNRANENSQSISDYIRSLIVKDLKENR